jgi:hypothetical protein
MWPFGRVSHRLNERFLAAMQYACRLHDGQRRKGSAVPYFSHPLAVVTFGSIVLNIVRAVSDAQSRPKGLWRNRKERFIGTIPNLEQSALHVLLADKLNNVQCILRDFRQHGDRVWLRFHGLLDDLTQAVFHLRELSTVSDRS